MAVSPTTGTHCVFAGQISGSAQMTRNVAGGGSVTTAQPFLNGIINLSTMIYWNGQFTLLGSTQSGSSYACHLAVSADGLGLWTDATSGTSGLPTVWQGGTNTLRQFLSASNGGSGGSAVALVAMCPVVGVSAQSRLLMLTTSAPVDITPSFLTPGLCLTGLAYCAVTGLWGVLAYGVGGLQATGLYTSSDLVTWTQAKLFSSCYAEGLAVVGNVWVVLANPQVPDIQNRIFYSSNVVAGSTSSNWDAANYDDP
jgi:hypothetical protein